MSFNKTGILLGRSHTDETGTPDCSYCSGRRKLFDGTEETGLLGHKLGFTTNKLKISDYEMLLDCGFTRCGTYCYVRN